LHKRGCVCQLRETPDGACDAGAVGWGRERLQPEILREWFPRTARSWPRRRNREVLTRRLRLQGVGDRGRKRATSGTLPCNLKTRLIEFFSKQPAGQKDYAQQAVNAVIRFA